VVDLVLDDLRRPAGKGLAAGLEALILPLHLDGLKPFGFPRAGQGQAALLGLVWVAPRSSAVAGAAFWARKTVSLQISQTMGSSSLPCCVLSL
jgi:hypothetical protein